MLGRWEFVLGIINLRHLLNMQVELVSLQSDEGICVKGSVQAEGVGFRVTSQATG